MPDTAAAAHKKKPHTHLGELASTAICGNDITSSCLYVSALAIVYAGKLAPLSLLMVAIVLYLFRSVYAEVVGALPLNGGAYNALLNTTSKFRASIAACLTVLSYMATAVISALEAMHYVANIVPGFPILYATIGLLALFMILSIVGITESAVVAIGIFITHIATLSLLLIVGAIFLFSNGLTTFRANMAEPLPVVSAGADHGAAEHSGDDEAATVDGEPELVSALDEGVVDAAPRRGGTFWMALFFGFSAAMLGISGFESSSNFVEEQAAGVFPKTLRNMWFAVSFFNPLMALLALALISTADVATHQNALLAHLGQVAGGERFGGTLSFLISVDAALVLSGAVLTSFVGVTGLVHRMTLDRCLPQFLLQTNRRGTTHRIIIGFFLLCVSVLFITQAENDHDQIKKLAGIYTISFLSVMALFGLGNILLKIKRKNLPRPTRATWASVIIGVSAVLIGLVGNVLIDPQYLITFLQYFVPTMLVIMIMLSRTSLLKVFLSMLRSLTASIVAPMSRLAKWVREKIDEINAQQIVFFTRGDNIANLNNALLYVRQNEHTNRLKVAIITNDQVKVPENLAQELKFLDQAYPEIDVEFVQKEGVFSPELIEKLSKEWGIPKNLMFIGSPGGRMPYDLAELGGVRLII